MLCEIIFCSGCDCLLVSSLKFLNFQEHLSFVVFQSHSQFAFDRALKKTKIKYKHMGKYPNITWIPFCTKCFDTARYSVVQNREYSGKLKNTTKPQTDGTELLDLLQQYQRIIHENSSTFYLEQILDGD
jgi:hypothetical protein